MATTTPSSTSSIISATVSLILCIIIFSTLRFYADWFGSTQLNTILGGFVSSWLFLFSLTSVSNVEMIVFGADFQAKFIPEILFSLVMSVIAAGVVHRVCATACILFSISGLYFINRISSKYHSKANAYPADATMASRKSTAAKKNK